MTPDFHYPPPVQVAFSGIYAETPSQNRTQSPITPSHVPPFQHTPQSTQFSPYPLTASHRAESRADSIARASIASMNSVDSRRSSSMADIRSTSPNASPPSTPSHHPTLMFPNGYSHYNYSHSEDPAFLFYRIRQNSEIRRASSDSIRLDATSLSQYSLGTKNSNREHTSSLNPNIHPDLATTPSNFGAPTLPNTNLPNTSLPTNSEYSKSPRSVGEEAGPSVTSSHHKETNRLSISNLMNDR